MNRYCEWVDVGFIHEKLVCKHCDSENTTRNHKLERHCSELEHQRYMEKAKELSSGAAISYYLDTYKGGGIC